MQLDADWNEFAEILDRQSRTRIIDTIGEGVVPAETADGFLIGVSGSAGSPALSIGRGRIYVDGLLAENHGGGNPVFDPVLAETHNANPLDYTQQPYFTNAAQAAPLPAGGGPYLVYIDVWQRELTLLEDPNLVESAVAVDTTTRMQTAWQVKWFLAPTGALAEIKLPTGIT